MATVNSVLGPIDTEHLGFTLTHEHIATSSTGLLRTYPELVDKDRLLEETVQRLIEARKGGVDTIVEVSTMDLGRDVDLIRKVSERSGVHFICSTGNHLYMSRILANLSADKIASLWSREIEQGIEGSQIKAGIIKVATSDPIQEHEELALRAAARTQHQTGAAITTHTPHSSRIGETQIRILEEEGVDLNRVYVGHVNSTLDRDYLVGMIEKGVWLGMDHYYPGGPPGTPTWQKRTSFLKNLIDEGYGDRIMLSHDWNVGQLGSPPWLVEVRKGNPHGYLWITRSVLPLLRELGTSEERIHQLMVDNPRRFFGDG